MNTQERNGLYDMASMIDYQINSKENDSPIYSIQQKLIESQKTNKIYDFDFQEEQKRLLALITEGESQKSLISKESKIQRKKKTKEILNEMKNFDDNIEMNLKVNLISDFGL